MSDKVIRDILRDLKLNKKQPTKLEHVPQLSQKQLMNYIKSLEQASRINQCESGKSRVCNEKGCTGDNGRGEECIHDGFLGPKNTIVFLNCVLNHRNSAVIDDPRLEIKLSDCVRHMLRDTFSYVFQVGESPYLTGHRPVFGEVTIYKSSGNGDHQATRVDSRIFWPDNEIFSDAEEVEWKYPAHCWMSNAIAHALRHERKVAIEYNVLVAIRRARQCIQHDTDYDDLFSGQEACDCPDFCDVTKYMNRIAPPGGLWMEKVFVWGDKTPEHMMLCLLDSFCGN